MPGADLDLKDLLALAIYREQAAKNLYSKLADSIKNPDAKKTFENLAGDEATHREKLEGWFKNMFEKTFSFDPSQVMEFKVNLEGQAGAVDALYIALDAEKKAATGYEKMAKSANDKEFSKLCGLLAQEEWGHFETINAEIQSVTDNFYWGDIDFAGHVED